MLLISYTIEGDEVKSLRIYRTSSGKEPFRKWLDGLGDGRAITKVASRVRRLALGQRGDWGSVGGGVLELRIHYGPGFRVYFAEQEGQLILLLLGGNKSSQRRDIQKARDYWQDYRDRYNEKD